MNANVRVRPPQILLTHSAGPPGIKSVEIQENSMNKHKLCSQFSRSLPQVMISKRQRLKAANNAVVRRGEPGDANTKSRPSHFGPAFAVCSLLVSPGPRPLEDVAPELGQSLSGSVYSIFELSVLVSDCQLHSFHSLSLLPYYYFGRQLAAIYNGKTFKTPLCTLRTKHLATSWWTQRST